MIVYPLSKGERYMLIMAWGLAGIVIGTVYFVLGHMLFAN